MLRITVSKGAKSAVNYFRDALSKQDYYSEHSKVMGQWHGKTAQHIGLSTQVSEQDFDRMVHNRHPVSGEKITIRDAANRRAGYDFTFNAPKSVSVVEAITKDEAIREAHRTAIERAMQEVEANMQVQVGQGKNKRYQTTGNMAYAAFEHYVTRPVEYETEKGRQFVPDPHLHTHCFVINATWNEKNERFQAIEVGNIKKNAPYYEALYHSHLAHQLQEAGYEIERTKNSFEIKGISRETIEKYSNRTLEIEKTVKEKGLDWAEDKAELGAKTRNNKNKSISETQMDAEWSARLTLQERFTIHSAKGAKGAASGPAVEKKTDGLTPEMAIDQALQHFMERKSAVTEKQVLGYALKLGIDRLNPEAVSAELDRRKGRDVFTGEKNSDTYITTREALLAEDKMKEFVVSTRSKFQGINPDYAPQKDYLNQGQKNAIQHALTSPDQVILIAGGAGVGKTTLMKEVQTGVEDGGKKLFAFAPSADASRGVLRSKSFDGADTIKKLLDDKTLQEQLRDQVILIDEAGMVGNQTMNSIFEIAKKQHARVILSGDWKQHNSVEAGDALRLLEQHAQIPVARVTEIVRQKERSVYREVIKDLAEGKTANGFQKLDKMGSIIEIEDTQERHERIANDYLASLQAPKIRERDGSYRTRSAIVVSPTHREGEAITEVIRAKLKDAGLVGTEEHTFNIQRNLSFTEAEKQDHLNYQLGMAVQFHKKQKGFNTGVSYEVIGISDQHKVMIQEQGKEEITPLPLDQCKYYQVFQKGNMALAQGDVLKITGNGKTVEGHSLNNGQSHTVKGFTKEGHILLDTGETLSKDYRNFTLGYYRTSHSSQGKDADDVFIAQSTASLPASNEKQFYVSASRGIERCLIYTDDKAALKAAAMQDANRMSAAEIAEVSRDKSLWLTARNAMSRQRMDYYTETMEHYSEKETVKGHGYDTEYESLGQEFAAQADRPGGHEPGL
ncbi:MAG: MobF family relaxase [Saprospiraceae bacterium]